MDSVNLVREDEIMWQLINWPHRIRISLRNYKRKRTRNQNENTLLVHFSLTKLKRIPEITILRRSPPRSNRFDFQLLTQRIGKFRNTFRTERVKNDHPTKLLKLDQFHQVTRSHLSVSTLLTGLPNLRICLYRPKREVSLVKQEDWALILLI